jgi:hypothetical protein
VLPVRAGAPPPSPFEPELTTQPAVARSAPQRLVALVDDVALEVWIRDVEHDGVLSGGG